MREAIRPHFYGVVIVPFNGVKNYPIVVSDTLHVEEFSHTRLSRYNSQKMQYSASIEQAKKGLTDTPFFRNPMVN